jgi:Luciferase-like monooxygenase
MAPVRPAVSAPWSTSWSSRSRSPHEVPGPDVDLERDYSTLDHLSDGRIELIIGKGNGAAQKELFHVTTEDQWDRNREGYELFRRLWREDKVTWEGRFRPSLHEAETCPRPLQQPIRVWHGSATSRDSVELAARYGDPLFSANVTNPIEPYAELARYYRERWVAYGHDPAEALVGPGPRASTSPRPHRRPSTRCTRGASTWASGVPVVRGLRPRRRNGSRRSGSSVTSSSRGRSPSRA